MLSFSKTYIFFLVLVAIVNATEHKFTKQKATKRYFKYFQIRYNEIFV